MKVLKIVFLFFIIVGLQLSPIIGMIATDRDEQEVQSEDRQSNISQTKTEFDEWRTKWRKGARRIEREQVTEQSNQSNRKRHLNAMIILDRTKQELRSISEAMKIFLSYAIKDSSYFIICSLSVFFNYLQNSDCIELVNEFEIYKHKKEDSGLILLIPNEYKTQVLDKYQACFGETIDEKIELGFDLENKFKTIDNEKLQEIKNMDKGNILRFSSAKTLESLKDIFELNKDVECGGKWNIIITGHGSPKLGEYKGTIADLVIKDYKGFVRFLNDELETNTLAYNTCNGGGANSLQLAGIKTTFPIIVFGTTDYYTYSISSPYKKYFEKLVEFDTSEKGIKKALMSVFKGLRLKRRNTFLTNILEKIRLTSRQRQLKNKYYNFPFVLFPKTDYFLPINTFPKEVIYLTATRLKALKIDKKDIEIKDNKKVIMVSPSIIPVSINIKQNELPFFISTFPGSSIHFFNEINFKSDKYIYKDDLIKLLQLIGTSLSNQSGGKVIKIFFIKKFKYKSTSSNSEIVLRNVIVDVYKNHISYKDGEKYYSKDFGFSKTETTPEKILLNIEDNFYKEVFIPFIDRKKQNYGSKFLLGQHDNRFIIEFINLNPVQDKKKFELLWEIVKNIKQASNLEDLVNKYITIEDSEVLIKYSKFIKQEILVERTTRFLEYIKEKVNTSNLNQISWIVRKLIQKKITKSQDQGESVVNILKLLIDNPSVSADSFFNVTLTLSFLAKNNLIKKDLLESVITFSKLIVDNPNVYFSSLHNLSVTLYFLAKNNLIKEDLVESVIIILKLIVDNPDVSNDSLLNVTLTLSSLAKNNLIKEDLVESVITASKLIIESSNDSVDLLKNVVLTIYSLAEDNLIKEDQEELVISILEPIVENPDISFSSLNNVALILSFFIENNITGIDIIKEVIKVLKLIANHQNVYSDTSEMVNKEIKKLTNKIKRNGFFKELSNFFSKYK